MTNTTGGYVGIDVAKDKLGLAILGEARVVRKTVKSHTLIGGSRTVEGERALLEELYLKCSTCSDQP